MEDFIVSTIRLSVPIVLAAVGVLFSLRARVFHLGIEGLMIMSAFAAVGVAQAVSSPLVATLGGVAASLALSLIYWFVIDRLQADTIIAGLGLGALATGLAAFLLQAIFDERGSLDTDVRLPRPVTGDQSGPLALVSELSILGWLTPALVAIAWFIMRRTRLGLELTAVGDYEYGARSAGIDPSIVRLKGILLTGIWSALAGVELALGGLSTFSESISGGRGFIALAAALFGGLAPIGTALAAVVFGAADAVGITTQVNNVDILPRPFILMIPYVLTILALVASSFLRRTIDTKTKRHRSAT
ncbi:MAG: ABC transporter permease [Actinomycetota bacterium]